MVEYTINASGDKRLFIAEGRPAMSLALALELGVGPF